MIKRIAAIGFIVVCTSIAWAILGSTIFYRTYSTDELLKGRVSSSWGTAQEQTPPTAAYQIVFQKQVTAMESGTAAVRTVEEKRSVTLPLEQTRANATLRLDYRKKGLLWYSTYQVDFSGVYRFSNPSDQAQEVTFRMHLPASQAVYDDLNFSVNDVSVATTSEKNDAVATILLQPHETAALRVAYRSHGLDNWSYGFGDEVTQVKDFQLHVTTNFPGFDLLENTLSPTEEIRQPSGWDLVWNYKNLVSGYHVGIALPQRLQPGPLAGRISYFAPVSLLFFFFALVSANNRARNRAASHELFFPRVRVLFLSSVDGLSGGSRLHPRGLRDLLRRFDSAAAELSAIGCGDARGVAGSGIGAICVPSTVLLRILFRGLHRSGDHHRRDSHPLHRHANHRAHTVGGKVCCALRLVT